MRDITYYTETMGFDASEVVVGECDHPGCVSIECLNERTCARVRCSQCAAVSINGVPCHETGCPNARGECAECDAPVPKRQRVCESCAENLWG